MRRITGERLTLSWQTVHHFTLTMEADMSEAGRLREALMERIVAETGNRLSYTTLVVKMVACALKRHPLANAEFADGRIKLHSQVNVGVAMAIEGGLLVPVIRTADTLSFAEITRHLGEFREKAASMSFTLDDLSGGTFTISNLGMFGVDQFTAIINPPQSAILALGRIAKKPVALPDDFPVHMLGRHSPSTEPIEGLHQHDCLELGFCHEGAGVFIVENKVLPFGAGDVSVINDLEMHRARSAAEALSSWSFVLLDPARLLSATVDEREALRES